MHISSQLSVLMIGSLKLFMVNTFINIYIIEINKAAPLPYFIIILKHFIPFIVLYMIKKWNYFSKAIK